MRIWANAQPLGQRDPSASDCDPEHCRGNDDCRGLSLRMRSEAHSRARDRRPDLSTHRSAPATLACPCTDLRDAAIIYARGGCRKREHPIVLHGDGPPAFPQGESPTTGTVDRDDRPPRQHHGGSRPVTLNSFHGTTDIGDQALPAGFR
jgi:hypothetical protein